MSRRQLCYDLKGLSFREFLSFEGVGDFRVLSFDELLRCHVEVSAEIATRLKILPLFRKYLDHGFYFCFSCEKSGALLNMV